MQLSRLCVKKCAAKESRIFLELLWPISIVLNLCNNRSHQKYEIYQSCFIQLNLNITMREVIDKSARTMRAVKMKFPAELFRNIIK